MKKLLNTLYITDEKAYLSLDSENIVCLLDNEEKFRIPFSNVDSILCFSYLGCSPAFMGKCVKNKLSLCFLSPQGRFLAKVVGETKGNVFLRKQQIQMFEENDILLIKNTVAAKLHNTIATVKRSLHDHAEINEDGKLDILIKKVTSSINTIYEASDIDVIRGIEGNCAKSYFANFNSLILQQKQEFYLTGRTKRPPLDCVNAVLSFLYTIYTTEYAAALESVGLDSYIGFYHTSREGRISLACDLVEETRCYVDRVTLTMINLKILNVNDFEVQISGAVFLNSDGRKKVLTFWQEKKREQMKHPYLKQKIQRGLLPYIQATLLAKYIRGDISEYPCYML